MRFVVLAVFLLLEAAAALVVTGRYNVTDPYEKNTAFLGKFVFRRPENGSATFGKLDILVHTEDRRSDVYIFSEQVTAMRCACVATVAPWEVECRNVA